ncbi:MAG: hypothetical protein APR53_10925 [Methanoculleus sp. SDB]|nr:MAG: hypothetical protein APR53_10925 [Methanoculleus sp. SDB]
MLNYGYSLLEAECLLAINATGLDAHVGFLHEMQPGKNSLAYDLQELFRFLVDMAIINRVETDVMTAKDFVRTERYALRLQPTGARKVMLHYLKQNAMRDKPFTMNRHVRKRLEKRG